MDIRQELIGVLHAWGNRPVTVEDIYKSNEESIADAIIARFPWLADEPQTEYGVERQEFQVGTVVTLWEHEAMSFAERTGWPLVSRRVYKTDWKILPRSEPTA